MSSLAIELVDIGVVTTGRADWGPLQPVLTELKNRRVSTRIIMTGIHFDEKEIEGFGLPIERVISQVAGASPESIAASIGLGFISFADLFKRWKPSMLLVLGDRYELLPAVVSASIAGIPIAHIHGGELTEGLMDDAIRHSISLFSSIHFVSHPTYGERIKQLCGL